MHTLTNLYHYLMRGLVAVLLAILLIHSMPAGAQELPYGCNVYGEDVYSSENGEGAVCPALNDEEGGGGEEGEDGGGLNDTGQAVLMGVSAALILTSIGLFVYFVRKNRHSSEP